MSSGPPFTIDDRRLGQRQRMDGDRRRAGAGRRRSPRMRTLKGAMIALPSGDSVRCIVRNISETGACLELQNPVFLHPTFQLVFDDPDWVRRPCHVVWRKVPLIGVEFDAPEPDGGPIRQAIRRLLARAVR